jgi:hypothetical protein
MYQEAEQRIFDRNNAFLEMVNDPVNPLTNQDLERLIARFPVRWARFSGFVGKLKDEVAA